MFPAHVWQRPVRSITPCLGSIRPPSLGRPPSVVSGYLIPPSVTDIRFSSSGLRTPNCTLLMVRSGHALSPEGGPPPCIAEVVALRRRKPHYKKPAPPPPKCSDPVGAATGKDLPRLGGKSRRRERWGREGRGGGIKRNERSFPPPFRRFFVSQKGKKKRRGKEKVGGGRRKRVTNK